MKSWVLLSIPPSLGYVRPEHPELSRKEVSLECNTVNLGVMEKPGLWGGRMLSLRFCLLVVLSGESRHLPQPPGWLLGKMKTHLAVHHQIQVGCEA